MKKIFLVLTVTAMIIISSAAVFANDEDEAHDAMITYSGTNAFANLLPEERQACMYWVSSGGEMSEICRNAALRLISEDPDAVTPSQRRALLAVASGTVSARRSQPVPNEKPKVIEKDNTGAIIAAGVVGIIAGMIIHNNTSGGSHHHHHGPPPPPPPPHYRPAPPHHHHHRMPPPRH